MLATFYAKALDADFEEPILGDRFAKQIVERIDYDGQSGQIGLVFRPAGLACLGRQAIESQGAA